MKGVFILNKEEFEIADGTTAEELAELILKELGIECEVEEIHEEELKPCPFCGHEAGVGIGPDGYFVNCTWCSASTDNLTPHGNTEQEAIEAWNKRATND